MALLSANSPLARAVDRLGDVVLLNVSFVVGCLPLVTIGASLSALVGTAMRLVRGEPVQVLDDFVTGYKENLRQGSVLGLLLGVLLAALVAWGVVIQHLRVPNTALFVLWALWFLVVARVLLAAVYVFGYQATFEDTALVVLRNARLMSVRHLGSSLLMLLVALLPLVVTVFYPQFVVYGLVWVLVGFAVVACAQGAVLNQVFSRYGLDVSRGGSAAGSVRDVDAGEATGGRTAAS